MGRLVILAVLVGCGGIREIAPVHPDVQLDWRCSDINAVKRPCAEVPVEIVGVGELVYIGATWEAVCTDSNDRTWKRGPYPKGCKERAFQTRVHCEPRCRLVGNRPIFDEAGPAMLEVTLVPETGPPYVKQFKLSVEDPEPNSIAVACRDEAGKAIACSEAGAAVFCVTARVDHREYVATSLQINGTPAGDVDPRGKIDLPERPVCHPVPQGASLDLAVGSQHHVEVFGPTAGPGYAR